MRVFSFFLTVLAIQLFLVINAHDPHLHGNPAFVPEPKGSQVSNVQQRDDRLSAESRDLHFKKHKSGIPYVPTPTLMQAIPLQVQQVEVREVHQEMSCPEGYDLVAGKCVVNELIQGDFICQPGYQMVDGQCAQFVRGRRDCPEGFRLSGNRCIATEVIPAEMMCEEGELDTTRNVCHIRTEGIAQCPPGFVMGPDEKCENAFPASKLCPSGYVMHKGGHCIKEVSVEATPVCPRSAQLDKDGKKCYSMQPVKPKCPKGYSISHDKSKCTKKVKKNLAPCPAGFSESSPHKPICDKMIEIPPELKCPEGASLDPATGQCELKRMSLSHCPEGFQPCRDQPNLCEKVVEEIGICPPRSTATGSGSSLRCQISIDHEIIECCQPGFELVLGRCERVEIFPASTECQGDCKKVLNSKPQYSCPLGFNLIGTRCTRQVSHPCSKSVGIPSECEAYQHLSSVLLRSGKGDMDKIPSKCIGMITASEFCPTENVIAAHMFCEGDATVENGLCVSREEVVRRPFCKVGTLDPSTGKCIKKTFLPIKTECPEGTTRIGNRCVEYQEHLPDFTCPQDAVKGPKGVCILRSPASASLLEDIRTTPIPVCPVGTYQGGMCYESERIPRQLVCPVGSIPSGKYTNEDERSSDSGKYCIKIEKFVSTRPHKKYHKPKYFCPDGTPAIGRHCHSLLDKTTPDMNCPPGWFLRNQLCIRSFAPGSIERVKTSSSTPFCPPGTLVQGKKCVATRESQVLISCLPGYQLQPNTYGERECVRFGSMSVICPFGTKQTSDGCIRTKSIAPTIRTVAVDDCAADVCES